MSYRNMSLALIVGIMGLLAAGCAALPTSPAPAAPRPVEQPAAKPALPEATVQESGWQNVVSAAKREAKLTIYSYNFTSDVGTAVSGAFKQKFGISVDLITGRGAEIAERIKTEQRIGKVVADLMDANSFQISTMTEARLTASSKELPAFQEKDAWQVAPMVDEQGHIVIHTLSYYDAWINTRLVKAGEEPRSLRELAQPKWKGRVILLDPTFSSSVNDFFVRLLRRDFIDLETVRAIGKNVDNLAINAPTAAAEVVKGTYAIQPGMSASTYDPFLREGAPVKAVALEEGTVVSDLAIAAIKDAPHPNAAKLFNNWLLSQEGQTIYLKAIGGASPRKDVPDFRLPAARTTPVRLIGPTDEDLKESTRLFRERFLVKLWKE